MVDHDAGYKRLFSHRQMVADLLTGFVDQALGEWLLNADRLEGVFADQ